MKFELSKYTKRIAADVEKLELLKKLGSASSRMADEIKVATSAAMKPEPKDIAQSASSLTKVLTGMPGGLGEYYFPPEIIGGSCPRIPGEEEEIVWNAAAEACDTERVHVIWQAVDNRIWYIAVRSADLASHAGSWCPFGSLLPGMKNASPPPVCYTYYGDEMATMMSITADGLQIFRGTSMVVRAKAERMSRELDNAPVIELVPDKIMQFEPAPWYSVSLFEDRARRILAAAAVFIALVLAGLSFLVWLCAGMSLLSAKHDLTETMLRTQDKTMELMSMTERLRMSPMRDQLAKFATLNDGLLAVDGFLEVYEIQGGKTRWRAIVPTNVTADRINDLGGKTIATTDQGVVIGNTAEIEYELANPERKK